MVPLGLPMVPLVPTFLPMVTLAPMVPLAAEKRSGFSCYQWYHWLPMVPLVKFPMVPLGEFRTHALFVLIRGYFSSIKTICHQRTSLVCICHFIYSLIINLTFFYFFSLTGSIITLRKMNSKNKGKPNIVSTESRKGKTLVKPHY